MNFISSSRVKEEKLDYVEITDAEGAKLLGWEITDADGVVYDAILKEDGTVDHPTGRYSGPDTFEMYRTPLDLIARRTGYYVSSNLYRCRDSGHFLEEKWFRSSLDPRITSATEEDAFDWFFEAGDFDEIELPDIGFLAISPQSELRAEIEYLITDGRCSLPDWVREHLRWSEPTIASADQHNEVDTNLQGELK
jgi:hypothetical protein